MASTPIYHPGFILLRLGQVAKQLEGTEDEISIENHQSNGMYCVHQARVRLKGDPATYRLILAPENAPIFINDDKRPVAEAFAEPLGGV